MHSWEQNLFSWLWCVHLPPLFSPLILLIENFGSVSKPICNICSKVRWTYLIWSVPHSSSKALGKTWIGLCPNFIVVRMGIKIDKKVIRRKQQPAYEGEGPPPCSDVFTAITIHAYQSLLSTLGTKCAWPWCICLSSEHKQGSNINMIIEVQTTKELHFHLVIINLSALTPTPRSSAPGWRTPVEIGDWKRLLSYA